VDDKTLLECALAWAREDVDAGDAQLLEAWAREGNISALRSCMAGPLRFGTAGLRGVVGPGSNAMNRSVIRKASLGLARYLKKQVEGAQGRGIVVGRDVRKLSDVLAMEAAGVFLAEGFNVFFWEEPCPTPLVPFALLRLGAAAGVMVTASHNPPAYNGYKAYWGNGAQMIPPHDEGIAQEMARTGPAKEIRCLFLSKAPQRPRAARGASGGSEGAIGQWEGAVGVSEGVSEGGPREGYYTPLGEEMAGAYKEWALGLRLWGNGAPLKIAYTAMHGIGASWVEGLLREAGHREIYRVEAQCTPDAAFPTLPFPNPEEAGALDLAMELVEARQAGLLLANDPDADRLAVGARDARGRFRMFSGNELGVLLGYCLLKEKAWSKPLLLSTVVSTTLLRRMCEALGARYEETLTGFKWIANRALELEREEGCEFVFGFEEALGYCTGKAIRDKDGISTALLVADLASHCAAQGMTLWDYLEQIFRRFGFHASRQKSWTFSGGEAVQKMFAFMEGLRKAPPWKLGGHRVVSTCDYQTGRCVTGSETVRLGLPPSNLVAFILEQGHRVLVRPSGTEPKMKVYMEWCEPLRGAESLEEAALRAQEGLVGLEKDCLQKWFSPSLECL